VDHISAPSFPVNPSDALERRRGPDVEGQTLAEAALENIINDFRLG
jgi:hypothetical protein